MIENSKRNYLRKSGQTLANPKTSRKTYWSLINTILIKSKISIILPLMENRIFILQCTTIDTGSVIPPQVERYPISISDFDISEERILKIIRSLNPNKAHGWDEISVRMIKLGDVSLIAPLTIIFANCLKQGIFPETWKYANVVPVHKKNEKKCKEKLPSYFSSANSRESARKTHI